MGMLTLRLSGNLLEMDNAILDGCIATAEVLKKFDIK